MVTHSNRLTQVKWMIWQGLGDYTIDQRIAVISEFGQTIDMTNAILIRTAVASEQKALEALQTRASLNNAGDRKALLANPDAIELPLEQITAGRVFVAERSDEILGFSAVLPREDGQAELDALFVEPNNWRHGIGRLLVERCAEAARAQGSTALHVVGNPHAEGFYLACGFKIIGSTETRFGVGILMRKMV